LFSGDMLLLLLGVCSKRFYIPIADQNKGVQFLHASFIGEY